MIFPTKKLVFLVVFPVFVFILFLIFWQYEEYVASRIDEIYMYFVYYNALILLVICIEGFTLPRKSSLKAIRKLDSILSIGFSHKIELNIEFKALIRKKIKVTLREDIDERMSLHGFLGKGNLKKGNNGLHYQIAIHKRGFFELKYFYITCFSLFGFVKKIHKVDCLSQVRVYPDLKSISQYALLARSSHLGLMGIRKTRRVGGDNDFERLREYTRDDEFRHIDWKATARSGQLIARTYQKTQNQTVVFLLDCGRMMTSEFEGRSLLDYALSSMLLLSWVALSEGDRVGFLAFSDKVVRYVKPESGSRHHKKLVQAGYDLNAEHVESNFDLAFSYLGKVCRQRSLLCLLTHITDDVNAGQLDSYLGVLAGKHLPFAVLLKQPEIESLIESYPQTNEDMFVQAGVADFLLWKEEAIQNLRNKSVLVLEALPNDLNTDLINEYLHIKARNLI